MAVGITFQQHINTSVINQLRHTASVCVITIVNCILAGNCQSEILCLRYNLLHIVLLLITLPCGTPKVCHKIGLSY